MPGTLRIFSREPTTEWTRTEYDDFPTCIDSRPGGAAADRGQARRLAAATFADPGAEYRPVPFWHLNGRLSSDEIVRQIEDAKNLAGFGGVTVLPVSPGAQHPTGKPCPGMEPAYLSREYFDRYEEMLRISERLGQKLIVYDDIDFPSGTAGGRLLREYPRYTRKLLEMQEFEVCGPARFEYPLAVSDTLRCMAVSAMETASRRIVDLGAAVRRDTLAWDVPDGVWKIMFFNCRYAVHPLVDYMEPEAVECCISMTYDQYAKRFGRYFGGVVDKVFFDDVGYVSMERTWTPAITGLFESRYGRRPRSTIRRCSTTSGRKRPPPAWRSTI